MIFLKSPTPSVPILIAAEVDVSSQSDIITFSVAPYSLLPFVVFKHMQSSAQLILQPVIRTFEEWSGSIPSEFATSKGLSILMSDISTSSQPAGWRVQNGAFFIVISVIVI